MWTSLSRTPLLLLHPQFQVRTSRFHKLGLMLMAKPWLQSQGKLIRLFKLKMSQVVILLSILRWLLMQLCHLIQSMLLPRQKQRPSAWRVLIWRRSRRLTLEMELALRQVLLLLQMALPSSMLLLLPLLLSSISSLMVWLQKQEHQIVAKSSWLVRPMARLSPPRSIKTQTRVRLRLRLALPLLVWLLKLRRICSPWAVDIKPVTRSAARSMAQTSLMKWRKLTAIWPRLQQQLRLRCRVWRRSVMLSPLPPIKVWSLWKRRQLVLLSLLCWMLLPSQLLSWSQQIWRRQLLSLSMVMRLLLQRTLWVWLISRIAWMSAAKSWPSPVIKMETSPRSRAAQVMPWLSKRFLIQRRLWSIRILLMQPRSPWKTRQLEIQMLSRRFRRPAIWPLMVKNWLSTSMSRKICARLIVMVSLVPPSWWIPSPVLS